MKEVGGGGGGGGKVNKGKHNNSKLHKKNNKNWRKNLDNCRTIKHDTLDGWTI